MSQDRESEYEGSLERLRQANDAREKIGILAGIDPTQPNFERVATGFIQNLETELCQQNAKYKPILNRESIETAFVKMNELFSELSEMRNSSVLSEAEKIVFNKKVEQGVNQFQHNFFKWYDGESAIGRLQEYFNVYTITQVSQRNILSLAMAYMRFTDWQPEFTEMEARRFLASRSEVNSHSRQIYAQYIRTFFKAQGIPNDNLPFKGGIKLAEEDRPKRNTYTLENVADFIRHAKMSDSPSAKYYAAMITTWGMRPIELGRITSKNIDYENHTITWRSAKRGLERVHKIPEQIRPYIYEYEPESKNYRQMGRVWQYLCRDISWRPRQLKGYGWYGFRHALITNLILKSKIQTQQLERWMGWRTGVASGATISNIYFDPNQSAMEEIDREMIEKHPFLPYW